jgi:Putative Flp pilus-assembly TadE/G-like
MKAHPMHISPERRGERGQTMALVAISLVSLLAMAALAIDLVTLYTARGQVERGADAAALAAAKALAAGGVTTDPTNSSASPSNTWQVACAVARNQATAVAGQNLAAGQTPNVTVTFVNAPDTVNCSTQNVTSAFGINPQVSVQVQVTGLPTFFSRIWSRATNTVSATATAEAYNPSNSSSLPSTAGSTTPIALSCVKPLLLPNCDPTQPGATCPGSNFIDPSTGAITNTGVIGETFDLTPNCGASSPCNPGPPSIAAGTPPNMKYYPVVIGTAGGYWCPGCSASTGTFEQDLGCCNTSRLTCGQPLTVDKTDPDPGGPGGEAATAGQCLIHKGLGEAYAPNCTATLDQDCLDTTVYPFLMKAGSSNPLIGKTTGPPPTAPPTASTLAAGDQISTSDSVVSLPIYDSTSGGTPSTVNMIGFLQVFIDDVNDNGRFRVTVLNVAGCGNTPSGGAIFGAGPAIPVRLIQNP